MNLEKYCEENLALKKQTESFRFLRPFNFNQNLLLKEGQSTYINFSSNDYLGLRSHPLVTESSKSFIEKDPAKKREFLMKFAFNDINLTEIQKINKTITTSITINPLLPSFITLSGNTIF